MDLHVNGLRALRPDRWRSESLMTACVIGGTLVVSHFVKALVDLRPDSVDFVIFYRSVQRWLAGGSLYDPSGATINYNAPQFHLVLLPFGALPLTVAFVAWTAVTVLAAAVTLAIVMRECAGSWDQARCRLFFAAVLLCAGTGAVVHLGQVGWIVAWTTTLAWRAARHSRWRAAGLWLGCAAALKPFLLVFFPVLVVRGRWRALRFAALAFAGSIAIGAGVFGGDALRDWIALLRSGAPAGQMSYFINASLPAILARAGIAGSVAVGSGLLVAAVSVWATRTTEEEDLAWVIGMTGAILASPLGWIYYAPLLAAPLAGAATEGQLPGSTWRIWPLLAFPAFSRELFQSTPILAVSAGSLYGWALLMLCAASVRAGVAGTRTGSP